MKFHLFAGQIYYARGGKNDFVETSSDCKQLALIAKKMMIEKQWDFEWWHIVDENMNVVAASEKQAWGSSE